MVQKTPIVAVVGFSKSGKTAIMEYIISNLTNEGFNVGTIKHIQNPRHSMDVKGKDSWRHSKAGAKVVICSSPNETAVFRKRENGIESIEEVLNLLKGENLDLILVEGFRSKVGSRHDIHKIVVVKKEREVTEAISDKLDPLLALVGPAELVNRTPRMKTPFLNLQKDGEQLSKLVRNLLS